MSNTAEIKLCNERLSYWREKYNYRRDKFVHYNEGVKRSERMHHPVARKLAEGFRSFWARKMGEAASEVNKYVKRLHELAPAETPLQKKEHQLASEHPECHDNIRKVVAAILVANPSMYITSTTGGTHAPNSYHYRGMAMDLGANDQGTKDRCGKWCSEHIAGRLLEGIHNPTLSVANYQHVSSSYWGSVTWAGHVDHVHAAA